MNAPRKYTEEADFHMNVHVKQTQLSHLGTGTATCFNEHEINSVPSGSGVLQLFRWRTTTFNFNNLKKKYLLKTVKIRGAFKF